MLLEDLSRGVSILLWLEVYLGQMSAMILYAGSILFQTKLNNNKTLRIYQNQQDNLY